MKVYQIGPKDFVTSQWAGGTTTQLFIYPSSATLAQRNFDFRLSSANVSSEVSEFTSLPGISRKLMVLEGQIQIMHKNHHNKNLQKFEQDAFQGDWITTSIGTCVDFNLMTSGKIPTELNHEIIEKNITLAYPTKTASWMFIYIATGKVSIGCDGKTFTLPKNHLLAIYDSKEDDIEINGSENSDLVVVLIQ